MSRAFGEDETEFRADSLVRAAAIVIDPFRGEPVPPLRVSAAQLIQMAEEQRERRAAVRSQFWWLSAPALLVILAAIVTLGNLVAVHRQHSVYRVDMTSGVPAVLPLAGVAGQPSAREVLVWLAGNARNSTSRPGAGRYTYVHLRTWSRSPGATGPAPAVRDEHLWWAADRSGRRVVAEVSGFDASPEAGSEPGSGTGSEPGSGTGSEPSTSVDQPAKNGSVTDYGLGKISVVIANPSADPPILASQLADHGAFRTGARGTLRAIRDLYRYHDLDPARRTAVLRVLAETEGLLSHGLVNDRARRTGIAITFDDEKTATREVAIFDPFTGRLLSYDTLSISRRTVIETVLFVSAERVDNVGV